MKKFRKISSLLVSVLLVLGLVLVPSTKAHAYTLQDCPISNTGILGVGSVPLDGMNMMTEITGGVTTSLNVRSGPGTNYKVVGSVFAHEEIYAIGKTINTDSEGRNWILIKYWVDKSKNICKAGWVWSVYVWDYRLD